MGEDAHETVAPAPAEPFAPGATFGVTSKLSGLGSTSSASAMSSAKPLTPSVSMALHKGLDCLVTLEREVRAGAETAPGSAQAFLRAADALHARCTELQAQISRLDVEARSAALEAQLGAGSSRMAGSAAAAGRAELQQQLMKAEASRSQAERDLKAVRGRLRTAEAAAKRVPELEARLPDLERRLQAEIGAGAETRRELEEARRRAVRAEALAEALQTELRSSITSGVGERARETELLRRVHALEAHANGAELARASAERKAEVCEAELVDTLARLYTLESGRPAEAPADAPEGGGAAAALSKDQLATIDGCVHHALTAAQRGVPAGHTEGWTAAVWASGGGVGEALASALLTTLRERAARQPLDGATVDWLYVRALGGAADRELVRAALLAPAAVDALSAALWEQVRTLEQQKAHSRPRGRNADAHAGGTASPPPLSAAPPRSPSPTRPPAEFGSRGGEIDVPSPPHASPARRSPAATRHPVAAVYGGGKAAAEGKAAPRRGGGAVAVVQRAAAAPERRPPPAASLGVVHHASTRPRSSGLADEATAPAPYAPEAAPEMDEGYDSADDFYGPAD